MKMFSRFFFISLLFIVPIIQGAPTLIPSPIEKVYIPVGFDDNDNVEIILKGTFPNACYRVGSTEFQVDHEAKEILVKAYSYFYQDQILCPLVISTFLQTIKVGLLASGEYQVRLHDEKDKVTRFQIIPRVSESADEFLYASVENAYIKADPKSEKQTLVLHGHHPLWLTGCQKITSVSVYRNPKDVLVVLPKTTLFEEENCHSSTNYTRFKHEIDLSEPMDGEGLIHVRTLNGESINRHLKPL